jgi:hypothetical protein
VTWAAIGIGVVAWFVGLLLEVGSAIHLVLVGVVALLVVELRRARGAGPA